MAVMDDDDPGSGAVLPTATVLALEPADLDGYSIDDLVDYLDAGCRPANPTIDSSPTCQIALNALRRLRALGMTLLEDEAAAEPTPEGSWVGALMASISTDARAGRSIPFRTASEDSALSVTEGAVRALIRDAGDAVPGLLITRSILDGDVTAIGVPIRIRLEVTLIWDARVVTQAPLLRATVERAVRRHTDLDLVAVDIVVTDVHRPSGRGNGTARP